jgi:ATP adenylyltransferase
LVRRLFCFEEHALALREIACGEAVDWDSSCPVNELKPFLESLWAPWRVEYFERPDNARDFLRRAAECTNDAEHYIVYRRKSTFLVMNLYPYSAGHLMAVPYREVSTLEELASSERLELIDLSIYAQRLLRDVVKAEAFNIGWNLGAAAGAGVEGHLHLHIVPRWAGDHNFMTVTGGTRIIPQGLRPLYDKLRAAAEHIAFPAAE